MAGEKKKEFAARIDMNPNILSRYFTGQSEPSIETLKKIALKTGCDLNWLATGQGHAYFPNPTDIDAGMWPDNKDTRVPGRPYDFGQEPVRTAGTKITRPMGNKAKLQVALSWIDEMDLDKESRDMLAEMIKDLVLDPDLRIILWEHLRFLKYQKIGKK